MSRFLLLPATKSFSRKQAPAAPPCCCCRSSSWSLCAAAFLVPLVLCEFCRHESREKPQVQTLCGAR